MRGFELDVELLDVQQLNDGLFGGRYDIVQGQLPRRPAALRPVRGAGQRRRARVRRRPAAGCGRAGNRRRHRSRGCCARARPPPRRCSTTACTPTRARSRRPCSPTSARAAARRRRPGRAHPRGPAHLPARRPDAGRGPGHVVRAAGGCAGAAGRDPGRPGAARRRGRRVRGPAAGVDRLRVGQPRRDAGHHPPPCPGDGRERDLALRRAVRQRPHRRPGRRGRARARGARANRARGRPVCRGFAAARPWLVDSRFNLG